MSALTPVIFATRHFADKIIFEITDIYIQKKSLSNAANVERVFVNLELWQFTGYFTWKRHLSVVLSVRGVSIKDQT